MSVFSIERVLWELTDNHDKVGQFLNDPDALLAGYKLSDHEREIIKSRDVRAMADLQVSSMLLMLFWNTVNFGAQEMPEYMRRMNTPAS